MNTKCCHFNERRKSQLLNKKQIFISGFNFFNSKFARFANYYYFLLYLHIEYLVLISQNVGQYFSILFIQFFLSKGQIFWIIETTLKAAFHLQNKFFNFKIESVFLYLRKKYLVFENVKSQICFLFLVSMATEIE